MHDTRNSTSLLTHLNANSINLLTTMAEPDPAMPFFHGTGMAREREDGSRYLVPNFYNAATEEFIPAPHWWEQVAFKLDNGHILTRKDVVLSAVNQDGGAHVDSSVKDTYASLASDGSGGTHSYITGGQQITQLSEDLHLVALRQFGYELQNSPELLSL
ncbi:MAG: hypothetical protein J5J00_09225 [Deltaproteobacteria bacterium]|nr:hypothetical protein [Deltaproteobacteria bacterium]